MYSDEGSESQQKEKEKGGKDTISGVGLYTYRTIRKEWVEPKIQKYENWVPKIAV